MGGENGCAFGCHIVIPIPPELHDPYGQILDGLHSINRGTNGLVPMRSPVRCHIGLGRIDRINQSKLDGQIIPAMEKVAPRFAWTTLTVGGMLVMFDKLRQQPNRLCLAVHDSAVLKVAQSSIRRDLSDCRGARFDRDPLFHVSVAEITNMDLFNKFRVEMGRVLNVEWRLPVESLAIYQAYLKRNRGVLVSVPTRPSELQQQVAV